MFIRGSARLDTSLDLIYPPQANGWVCRFTALKRPLQSTFNYDDTKLLPMFVKSTLATLNINVFV